MYRILVADDEVIERTILEKKLNRYYKDTCEIRTVQNGRELLEVYDTYHPDILILDIEMPVINGLEAAREIRRRDEMCNIIFLTAFDDFSYAKEAFSVRAVDYLLKPCDEKELYLAVEEAIRLNDLMKAAKPSVIQDAYNDQHDAYIDAAADINNRKLSRTVNSEIEVTSNNASETGHPDTEANQVKLLRYIHDHYMEDISIQDISEYLGYSEVYSCRLFKQYFGQNFVSYLAEFRMKKAANMLHCSHLSIKEIGKAVGYNNSNYFAKVFHRLYGMTPSEYRESHETAAQKFIPEC